MTRKRGPREVAGGLGIWLEMHVVDGWGTGGVLELVGNWENKELVDDKIGWKRRLFRTG